MAFVVPILALLLFGILEFGFIMSFRGSMAQAASEAARAAATAPRPACDPNVCSGGHDNTEVIARANAALAQAVSGFNQTCNSGGLTCNVSDIHDCSQPAGGVDTYGVLPDCITVHLHFDYKNHPLLPQVPLLPLPSSLDAQSTVELNNA